MVEAGVDQVAFIPTGWKEQGPILGPTLTSLFFYYAFVLFVICDRTPVEESVYLAITRNAVQIDLLYIRSLMKIKRVQKVEERKLRRSREVSIWKPETAGNKITFTQ